MKKIIPTGTRKQELEQQRQSIQEKLRKAKKVQVDFGHR